MAEKGNQFYTLIMAGLLSIACIVGFMKYKNSHGPKNDGTGQQEAVKERRKSFGFNPQNNNMQHGGTGHNAPPQAYSPENARQSETGAHNQAQTGGMGQHNQPAGTSQRKQQGGNYGNNYNQRQTATGGRTQKNPSTLIRQTSRRLQNQLSRNH